MQCVHPPHHYNYMYTTYMLSFSISFFIYHLECVYIYFFVKQYTFENNYGVGSSLCINFF